MSSIFNTSGASSITGKCNVTTASHQFKMDAPVLVGDLRSKVGMIYPQLTADHVCYKGTTPLAETDTVNPGDNVSFLRKMGEKG